MKGARPSADGQPQVDPSLLHEAVHAGPDMTAQSLPIGEEQQLAAGVLVPATGHRPRDLTPLLGAAAELCLRDDGDRLRVGRDHRVRTAPGADQQSAVDRRGPGGRDPPLPADQVKDDATSGGRGPVARAEPGPAPGRTALPHSVADRTALRLGETVSGAGAAEAPDTAGHACSVSRDARPGCRPAPRGPPWALSGESRRGSGEVPRRRGAAGPTPSPADGVGSRWPGTATSAGGRPARRGRPAPRGPGRP